MHRMPSSKAIRRLRLAALLLCAKCVLTPVAAGVILWGLIMTDSKLVLAGLVLVVLVGMVVFLQWIVGARTNCPLCITPVMASKGCTRHRNARPFLGSYRLRVALQVLFTGGFRCPYCGERTVLAVRER